ncbi:hypothetical protein Fot_05567 [Forsythia ovata]|uniref:Uncharacterized protein n=1 Tax=Forsythia ovata TaxID=205694 RepID=A0ABD1WTB6_9LAMI
MDVGDSDLEEIGGTASGEILVMAEPVRAICSIFKMVFNAHYFKMFMRKRLEKLHGIINLSDSYNETDGISLMMAKLTVEEAADLQMQRQRDESTRQRKGKEVAGPSGAAEPDGDGELISPKIHRVNLD